MASIGIVAAGAMGAAIGRRLVRSGCTVFTDLNGRSPASHQRAKDAGMQDLPLNEFSKKCAWVLSILPPRDALSFAQHFRATLDKNLANTNQNNVAGDESKVVFVDCNAVNPTTVQKIRDVFAGTNVRFLDAGIIGGPPKDSGYTPTIYASAAPGDLDTLQGFVKLNEYGMKIVPLTGEGADVGAASALKMSYAGMTKGVTGILTAMVLAAHRSSPATADALLHELNDSAPALLSRITASVPGMIPKAYRWVDEMYEISDFVGEGEGDIHRGIGKLYERVQRSLESDSQGGDVEVLNEFVTKAKELMKDE
ncbi:6-phosphogluconate dehydrogenase [Schizophyllum commune]